MEPYGFNSPFYPPSSRRRSTVPQEVIGFIRDLRGEYPKLGREKIKPFLHTYCQGRGIKTISESTIGNIIKRHKFFFQKSGRMYHDPSSRWAQKKGIKKKRLRVKRPPKPKEFGYIVSDTVERVTDGIKDYFYSGIDAKLKSVLTLNYKRLTAGI